MIIEDLHIRTKKNPLNIRSLSFNEFLFCICVISIFLPIKIYPVFFLISSIFFSNPVLDLKLRKWTFFLIAYILYTLLIFAFKTIYTTFIISNIVKLIINFIFLISSINWLNKRNNKNLLYWLDKSFWLIFILIFLQLLVYHYFSGFVYLKNIESSAEASSLYNQSVFFWGVFDKNMLGAKIALLGYIYIIINIVLKNTISILRILFIFLLSYLSLSRTPIGVIFIGMAFILFYNSKAYQKIILFTVSLAALPIILNKLIRIDSITNLNDGMGIRLLYWATFFENFNFISPFGNGFLAAGPFLEKYAYYYNGEPNLHNTFLNTYLDVGVIGLVFYLGFLFYMISYLIRISGNKILCLACFITLIANMMILFTGYDNDVIVYISITYLLCIYRKVNIKNVRWGFL